MFHGDASSQNNFVTAECFSLHTKAFSFAVCNGAFLIELFEYKQYGVLCRFWRRSASDVTSMLHFIVKNKINHFLQVNIKLASKAILKTFDKTKLLL